MRTFILSILFAVTCVSGIRAQQVAVTIHNIRSASGSMVLGIYKDQSSFEKESPAYNKVFSKPGQVSGGTMKVSFSLPPGEYGISLLDDENGDGKMEYTWYGMPDEGFGFADYYHTGWSKPKFDSFRVSVKAGETRAVQIKVRYL